MCPCYFPCQFPMPICDPYTGDPTFEATPVVSRFPPPTGPPPQPKQDRDRHEPWPNNKREAPSPSVNDTRQRPAISRMLSSPKMAIANLLYRTDSPYGSGIEFPPPKTSVNWCECAPTLRKDDLSPGKDLVMKLVKVSGFS